MNQEELDKSKVRLVDLTEHVGMHTDVQLVYDSEGNVKRGHKILLRQLGDFLKNAIDRSEDRINCQYPTRGSDLYPSAEFVTNLIFISMDNSLILYFLTVIGNAKDKVDFANFLIHMTNPKFVKDAIKILGWSEVHAWMTELVELPEVKLEDAFHLDLADFDKCVEWIIEHYTETPLTRIKLKSLIQEYISRRYARFEVKYLVQVLQDHQIELEDKDLYNVIYHICNNEFLLEYKETLAKVFHIEGVIAILNEIFSNIVQDYESVAPPTAKKLGFFPGFTLKDRSGDPYINESYVKMKNVVDGIYACTDASQDWPEMDTSILDKFVHRPKLYIKLFKFNSEKLFRDPAIFNKVFKHMKQQTREGVQYHHILQHFYKDVSEMPYATYVQWFKILSAKKWLISEIADKLSLLDFKKKSPLSEQAMATKIENRADVRESSHMEGKAPSM